MLQTLTTKAYISITESIRRFKENQQGVTAIEYGLIAVAMAALVATVFYGEGSFVETLKTKFSALTDLIADKKEG
ncbi:Flp family type IVb pilin [Gallibacterium genomosp. 3]|uniref:Fimbrial protein n=1 Tax=Gallibacterium genomosp. 3 TaxID=505345 RepID=A0A1A7QCX8_9PAST|nr:Flp family type IVb pilin [Gallibacterium genomosp. 3]OBX11787.1 fimbrial protein [Gallibacterium genomosp. 3]